MIRAPRSLLARILAWHAVAVVLTALAVSAGVYLFLDATADHLERQTLRAQAASTRDALTVTKDGRITIAASGSAGRVPMAAGMGVVVLDRSGLRASPSGSPPVLAIDRIPRYAGEAYFRRRSRRAFYAGLSVPVTIGDHRLWIVAIQNLDHPANVIDDIVRQFLRHGLLIVLPLLLLLLGVDALIVRRALRPVRRASQLVRTIDASQSDVRVIDPEMPSEVQPLAQAFNTALERLTLSLRTQRDFTADAAHELRTPITVARVRASEIEDLALRTALVSDLDGLAGIVGHLLEIAELDALGEVQMQSVDLADLARQNVAAIAPLVVRVGKSIELVGADRVIVQGQRDFLSRALGALVENAVKHTTRGTHIIVGVQDGVLWVEDDGEGIGPSEQDLVFRRFWRRDRGAGANAGLGLAIVRRVAEVHQGHATVVSRPGSTKFSIHLPHPEGCA